MLDLLVYVVENQKYATRLEAVESVVSTVALTKIPNVSPVIMGAINKRGQVIPVISLRRIFKYPDKEPELSDHIIVCHNGNISFALYVDDVIGVESFLESDFTQAEDVCPDVEEIEFVIKHENELILVYNPEALETIAHLQESEAKV